MTNFANTFDKEVGVMTEFEKLKEVKLSKHHQPTGAVKFYQGSQLQGTPAALQIQKSSDGGIYLIHLDVNGEEQNDSFHESVEEAMLEAKREFGVEVFDWTDIS